ncbi:hypothetical protein LOK49_LG03G02758 [Camellia lanceoleosa]|uniref:Uncharacterized protein n=1 Tax=Camellia lanceoleosa TaxID=1840588 RepID=A0ACC0IFY4_9ERIC|nr:hypothetical protein LOK49_LG03G02758 [Camellia lanceoleosa]
MTELAERSNTDAGSLKLNINKDAGSPEGKNEDETKGNRPVASSKLATAWRLGTLGRRRYPDAAKFRRMPLQFTEDLDILFLDAVAIEEWAYTLSSGVMPNTNEIGEEFHTPHDAEFRDDVDLECCHTSMMQICC